MKSSLRKNQPSWLRRAHACIPIIPRGRFIWLRLMARDIAPVSLPFTAGQDEAGRYIEFTQPALAYWNMIFLR